MTDSVRHRFPVPLDYPHAQRDRIFTELLGKLVALQGKTDTRQLSTKSLSDPTVALLNAWATLADVTGFYQERIAAESYLSTATEPESVLALASLLGYRRRPGLTATCWLAYTLIPDPTDTAVLLPKYQVVQSVPGTGELPQTFETTEDIVARPSWNTLSIKASRPLPVETGQAEQPYLTPDALMISGATSRLEPNDVVLITPSREPKRRLIARVKNVVTDVKTDVKANTTTVVTTVVLQQPAQKPLSAVLDNRAAPAPAEPEPQEHSDDLLGRISSVVGPLSRPPSTPPSTETAVPREFADPAKASPRGPRMELPDMTTKLLTATHPDVGKDLYRTLATSTLGKPEVHAIDALTITTAPFGVQVPPRPRFGLGGELQQPEEWPIGDTQTLTFLITGTTPRLVAEGDRSASLTVRIDGPKMPSDVPTAVNINLQHPTDPHKIAGGSVKFNVFNDYSGELIFDNGDNPALERMTVKLDQTSITAVASSTRKVTATLRHVNTIAAQGRNLVTGSASASGLTITAQMFAPDPTGRWTEGVIDIVSALPVAHRDILHLNERRDEIVPASYVMVDNPSTTDAAKAQVVTLRPGSGEPSYPLVAKVLSATPSAVNRYGMSLTVTRLKLDTNWIKADARLLSDLRPLVIHANSGTLDLLPAPFDDPIRDPDAEDPQTGANYIDLEDLHPGIDTGRRLILTGTRDDLGDASVSATELLMVSGVTQRSEPGAPPYTRISLASRLAYPYRRDSVKLYGNVVPAHHGVTMTEVLTATGGSDHTSFTLSHTPVLADAVGTESGFALTLKVVVDGRTWTRAPRLDERTPPRCYLTGTDGNGRTTITLGQPLPSPNSTVTATYRSGEGGAGNVRADQLTQLLTRPLAVASVRNPLPASGGADADGPDAVRLNAPRGLKALGRVVSVEDAADIALTWAGIGKSKAALARDQQHLTVAVAGITPVPLVKDSQLITALRAALIAAGDVTLQIDVRPADVSLIVLVAQIDHDPDISWDTVEPAVRAALLDAYSYDHRDIDEEVIRSDIYAVIHRVDGVRSCSMKTIGTVPYKLGEESNLPQFTEFPDDKARNPVSGVSYFSHAVPETLILQEASG